MGKSKKKTDIRAVRAAVSRIVYSTSLYFTIITLAFYIVGTILGRDGMNLIPTLRTVIIILAFSLAVNLANMLLHVKKLATALRVALHYVIVGASLALLFFLAADFDASGWLVVIALGANTLVYAAVCAVVFGVRGAVDKSKIEKSDYTPIYGNRI